MIRYNSILTILVIFACLVQQFIPSIGLLYDVRVLLVPVVYLSAALTGGAAMMLFLAFIGGFLWDCQHTLNTHAINQTIYTEGVESLHFGYSIILYALMGVVTLGFTPLFRSGKWQIPTLIIGVTIYAYLWVEFLLINIVRGNFSFIPEIFLKVSFTAALSMLTVPLMLFAFEKIAVICNHTIKNDNRRRFFNPDRI